MAPGRLSSTRRIASRAASGPSSISSQMQITKPGSKSNSPKDDYGLRSSTRQTTQIRPLYRESSVSESSPEEGEDEDEEHIDETDDEEEDDVRYNITHKSQIGNRRSLRAANAARRSATNARASRAAARDRRAMGTDLRKAATGRVSGISGQELSRPRKFAKLSPTNDVSENDDDEGGNEETSIEYDEAEEEETSDDVTTKNCPIKSPAIKRNRGRPPEKAGRNSKKIETSPSIPKPEDCVIPNWLDLRMQHAIWVQIFRSASLASDEEDIQNVNWLLRTARVCRDFADPALTVLYRCPSVTTEKQARGLAQLLEKPLSMTAVNYRAKIKALHIDVRLVSLQRSYTPAIKLIQNLPCLTEVLLSHGYDQAPYRSLVKPIKWTYPPDLWQAFVPSPTANPQMGDKTSITRLQSWQWSSRLMDKDQKDGLVRMKEIHQIPSFVTLRKIRLVNYQLPSVRLEKDDPEILAEDERSVNLIADALSVLKNLEQLVFESSTILCTALFPLLTTKLKRLELVNCAEVTADDLGSFLISNGHQMEALVLNHNRSLSLAFLTVLGTACPHLKELRANFKYFSLLEAVDANEPLYDQVLLPDHLPDWPSALETIHLENLRRWDMETAEMFLQSFIDSAKALPMLRHLSVKAMLDIPWRQRRAFRKSWQEKLDKVFLRPVKNPEANFTLRRRPAAKPAEVAPLKRKRRRAPGEPTRRSNRVVPHGSGRSSRASSKSRELRDLTRKPKSYREPDSDEFDSEEEDYIDRDETAEESRDDASDKHLKEEDGAPALDGKFMQGLCTVVDISIDNQKPRERQYSMDDFLNEEGDFETDDEWNGDVDFE